MVLRARPVRFGAQEAEEEEEEEEDEEEEVEEQIVSPHGAAAVSGCSLGVAG